MREDDTRSYFLTDHLGSIVAVTDGSGLLISETRYLPFGEARTDVGSITETDYGFTNQQIITGTGLVDYNARMYDPSLGRFTQPDSLVPDPTSSIGFNRYAYVNNNPIRYSDPSGHIAWQGDGGGYAGELNYNLAKDSQLKCKAGNKKYCSNAQNHPRETAAFVIGGLGIAGILGAAAGGTTVSATTMVTTGTTAGSAAETIYLTCGGDCSDEFGQLTRVAENTWQSSKGLLYGPRSSGGNTIMHILEHMRDLPLKDTQGVFTVPRSQVLPLIDKAWVEVQSLSSNLVAFESTSNARTGYIINMGQTIGYIGGELGLSTGFPSTTLLNLVLDGTQVISAYPYPPLP